MAKKEQPKLCDCPGCTQRRFYFCHEVEQQIEANRIAGKPCPPPIPEQNAPSTFRLQ